MKHELKYLKLFEAFESIKLAKTLKFINKVLIQVFLKLNHNIIAD